MGIGHVGMREWGFSLFSFVFYFFGFVIFVGKENGWDKLGYEIWIRFETNG